MAAADRVAGDHRHDRLGQPADLHVQVGHVKAPDARAAGVVVVRDSPSRRARAGRRPSRTRPGPRRSARSRRSACPRARRSSAREISTIVRGRKALRTSGRAIVIFAMPASSPSSARSGCPSKSPPASRRASVQAMLTARRLACAAWSSRHGSRARRRARPRARRRWRRPTGSCTYASCSRRASAGAGAARARAASQPGERVAIALPAGPRLRARRCTRACCSAPSPCRSTCACRARARARSPTARRASSTSRWRRRGRRRSRLLGAPRHDLDATARRDPHLRHQLRAQAGRADLRQPAVERARLGRRARVSTRDERWLCALPLSHVGGLSILVRSAIYATTAVVHERFETERVLHALREQRDHARRASSRRRSRGCSTPGLRAPPALRCGADRRRPGARRRSCGARTRRACR